MGVSTGLVDAKSKQSRQMLPHCSMGSRLAAARHCSTVTSVSLLSGTSPASAPAMTDSLAMAVAARQFGITHARRVPLLRVQQLTAGSHWLCFLESCLPGLCLSCRPALVWLGSAKRDWCPIPVVARTNAARGSMAPSGWSPSRPLGAAAAVPAAALPWRGPLGCRPARLAAAHAAASIHCACCLACTRTLPSANASSAWTCWVRTQD